MKNFIFTLLLFLTSFSSAAFPQNAFSVPDLDSALQRGGLAKRQLYALQTFANGSDGGTMLTVLSGSTSGWRISAFRHVASKFEIEWTSPKLPNEFSVSSAHNFDLSNVGDEPVVIFSGCAPHDCGGKSGVGGFLLYSTSRKQAFYACYRGDNGRNGSWGVTVTFSKSALEAENKPYKQALQNAVDALPAP